MNILALDLGTNCGWAYYDGKRIKSGVLNLTKDTHFDGAGVVFLKFEVWLQRFREAELIMVEGVMSHDPNQTFQQHRYGGLLAIVQKFGDKHSIPYTAEGVSTIKKFWTGRARASKEAMVEAARDKGFNPKDDNEADALAILHIAIDTYGDLK